MEYKHVAGPVYCRYANTPPIVNSELANQYGIRAHSFVELDEGSNVKVSILLDERTKRMTCHAKVAWVQRDEAAAGAFDERWEVGLSPLSLSDAEFQVLLGYLGDGPVSPLELRDRVRDVAAESAPATYPGKEEGRRIKAVTMPITLIEEIDAKRGDVPFSEFVSTAVREHLAGR
jgi:hypothetical protein